MAVEDVFLRFKSLLATRNASYEYEAGRLTMLEVGEDGGVKSTLLGVSMTEAVATLETMKADEMRAAAKVFGRIT